MSDEGSPLPHRDAHGLLFLLLTVVGWCLALALTLGGIALAVRG